MYTYAADFRDIIDGQRIVYTYEMHADEDLISVSVATVEFPTSGLNAAGAHRAGGIFRRPRHGGSARGRNAVPARLLVCRTRRRRCVSRARRYGSTGHAEPQALRPVIALCPDRGDPPTSRA